MVKAPGTSPLASLSLGHRNVYILPTRAGGMLGVTLAVLLVGAINYQLSLGYLLAFVLAGGALAALFQTHATLRGLVLSLRPPEPGVDGAATALGLRLQAPRAGARLRCGIEVQAAPAGASHWRTLRTPAVLVPELARDGTADVTVTAPPRPRGVHPLPTLRLTTRLPLGLFRAWAVWTPPGELLVAPRPEAAPPPWPEAGAASDMLEGLRPWRAGESMRQIAWRKSAQADAPISRDRLRDPQVRAGLWIDWDTAGPAPLEPRLSRLAAWLDLADRAGLTYGLRLPGLTVPPQGGAAHRRRCLEALARC